jgi:hypothetical protein
MNNLPRSPRSVDRISAIESIVARSIDEIEAEQKSRKDSVKLNFVPNKE